MSPDRLFPSFRREVIDRKPYIFKIAALRDIRSLFPQDRNPFYAGFGNRESVGHCLQRSMVIFLHMVTCVGYENTYLLLTSYVEVVCA